MIEEKTKDEFPSLEELFGSGKIVMCRPEVFHQQIAERTDSQADPQTEQEQGRFQWVNAKKTFEEPKKLLITWRNGKKSKRHIVAELFKDGGEFVFRYLKNTASWKEALDDGFAEFNVFSTGLPFDLNQIDHRGKGVIDFFMTRLPPRWREDFRDYLESHGLPRHLRVSAMSLLANTAARLPGDGIEVFGEW